MIKLEMIRGRMSILSIRMSISPGKAINITTSGWMGDAKRRSPPQTAPRMTPIHRQGGREKKTKQNWIYLIIYPSRMNPALRSNLSDIDLSRHSLLSDDE